MAATRQPHHTTRLEALFTCPFIHDLAHDIGNLGPRRRRHPVALHLAYGALARLYGSANRLDAELAHRANWDQIVTVYNTGAANHPHGIPLAAIGVPITADTYRHFRDRLCDTEHLDTFLEAFTLRSVGIARAVGLLHPNGPGSRTRPAPSRTIYGDGTIVRPLYKPEGKGRHDPDAERHTRHDGHIWGNDLVTIATRGPNPHQRVILAVGRVHQRGREADTAVELIGRVHRHAGEGIQAVVYDGAFRGTHHEQLMSRLGLIVVNKVHPATADADTGTKTYRQIPLGQWTHTVRNRTCTHTLVTNGGTVHDSALDDTGTLTLSEPLPRQQIRRYPRGRHGGWRFTLGVHVLCPKAPFTAWISPHPQTGDTNHRRPDQLRLIPESDPWFQTLYGLRNDSEAINAAYKRTLVADRAATLGWRRQLLDLASWATLTNTLAWQQHGCPGD